MSIVVLGWLLIFYYQIAIYIDIDSMLEVSLC